MPIIGSYHHVHLISEDPEAVAGWYVKVLGAEITGKGERRGARNVTMRLGEANLFVRSPRPTDRIAAHGDGRPPGVHHLGFQVEDIEGILRRVEENGGSLAEPAFTGQTGNTVVFLLAPDNVIIELIQPPKA